MNESSEGERVIQVAVNGEFMQVPQRSSLQDLVERLQLTGKRIAVEVNLEIVPRSQHQDYQLQAGDKVEIVHAIGGG